MLVIRRDLIHYPVIHAYFMSLVRHPEPDSRPTFTMILLSLLEYEKHIREVQNDEDIIHKHKDAPSSSENEYLELQQWYVNEKGSTD